MKIINDAAIQALGSYDGGRMLFLGLGTGLGSTLIADGVVQPMELGHLPYKKGSFDDYVGIRGPIAGCLPQAEAAPERVGVDAGPAEGSHRCNSE